MDTQKRKQPKMLDLLRRMFPKKTRHRSSPQSPPPTPAKLKPQPPAPEIRSADKPPPDSFPESATLRDLSAEEQGIIQFAQPFTMTSADRMVALINAVNHIARNGIRGDIVECGVWRGGSMMAVARTLLSCGDESRSLYLFDTFEGMPQPGEADRSYDGVSAISQLEQIPRRQDIWCYASLDDVKENLFSTGYPREKIHFIKGKVEDTIPQAAPRHLSLLRLDTDWYESTKHELQHLYPLLEPNGILIIDDYGHW